MLFQNYFDLRNCLSYIVLFISLSAGAQSPVYKDTIKINEVIISGKKTVDVPAGFSKIEADTFATSKSSSGSIADVISLDFPVYVKSYGSGGSATPSFRGLSASGTQVIWNGIRIDNPMLGQADLSILPAGMADMVSVYFGGSSMSQGSGAAGGLISVESEPEWDSITSLKLNPAAGSFGRYSGMLTLRTGHRSFYAVTRAFYQSAENNFSYMNKVSRAEPFRDIRKNSDIKQQGLMQELYHKNGDNILSARIWYQDARRNLPSSLLAEFAGEKQYDASVRSMVTYEGNSDALDFSLTGAWMNSNLDYSNRLAGIDSRNKSNVFILNAAAGRKIFNNAELRFILNEELTVVNSNNYADKVDRNTADASLSLSNLGTDRIEGSLLVRQILHKNELLIPDFAVGLHFRPFSRKEYYIKSNFSRSSRIPSMNDLYWYPGGNQELKNEYAILSEAGIEIKETLYPGITLNHELTIYNNYISDMIQWRPGAFSYWSAANIQNVRTRGLETSLALTMKSGKVSSVLRAGYNLSIATDESDQTGSKQLIYVPENMANASIRVSYGKFHAVWFTNFTGRRYTSIDNTGYLPGNVLNGFSAGALHSTDWGTLGLDVDIDNLFNTEYQNIAYFPLPGRSFTFRLIAQITYKK